ncbi:hypothetical protein [Psychroflexus sp. ALD_RP9]|uniref:hypothetical protein n=1 Tax=Psychroflexus sp. ALD_RP9 TaxID=2777186 RepID=UPI001A8D01CA|nr:hypothetical protein [Psychroflexus sp. ALD_RP9]QSS97892.1 hypothetical protein IMZ30_04045 [Psychroflexus sp. ALD_RP9]
MKKDIPIPEVSNVYVAAILENDVNLDGKVWTVYLINQNKSDLETVLIVSEGNSETQKTSILRKKIETLPAQSIAKIEFLQDELLAFKNKFKVSYFLNNILYHKDFVFEANSISEKQATQLQLIDNIGILAQ